MTTTKSRRTLTLPESMLATAGDGCTARCRPATKAAYHAYIRAQFIYSRARAFDAATLVSALWPDAETLTFSREDIDGDLVHKLLLVRDAAGSLLWFNPAALSPSDHAEASRFHDEHGLPPALGKDTRAAIVAAVADAADADSDTFDHTYDDELDADLVFDLDVQDVLTAGPVGSPAASPGTVILGPSR